MRSLSSYEYLLFFKIFYCFIVVTSTEAGAAGVVVGGISETALPRVNDYSSNKTASTAADVARTQDLQQLTRHNFQIGIAQIAAQYQNGSTCGRELEIFLKATASHNQLWSSKVINTFGGAPRSFIWGNYFWFAPKELCEDLNNPFGITLSNANTSSHLFNVTSPFPVRFTIVYLEFSTPHYIDLKLSFENLIHLGLCFPRSCDADQIRQYTDLYFQSEVFELQREFQLRLKSVAVKIPELRWTFFMRSGTLIFISILAFVIMLTILAELMHKYKKSLNQQQSRHSKAANKSSTSKNNNNVTAEKLITAKSSSTFEEILLSFRLTENFQRALKLDKSDSFLGVIAGLRTIICLWVTVFHVYYYSLFALTNTALVFAKLEQFILQPVIQACFYVDVFFVISALLHVSNFLANAKQLQLIRNGNFHQNFVLFCKMVFYRYLRLTPVMIITLLLSDMLNDFLNMYSPFYLGPHSGIYCKTNWWYNLLYIHNILDMENICCSWTWYLACEMQFYILFTVLLFIHAKNAKAAKIAFAVLTLGFVAIAWLCNYRNGITFQIDVIHSTLSQLYVKSWVRCIPYIVGVAFGWLMHYYRHHHHHHRRRRHHQQHQQYWQRQQQEQLQYEHRLQKQLQQQQEQQQQQVQQLEHHTQHSGVESTTVDLRVSVWRAVFWLFFATIYVFTNFMSYWRSTPSWLVAIIMSFGKLLFAICIGGVILLCAFGHGGYFDALLSARPFLFMNKFCFSVYMVAPVIVFASFGLRSEATNFTEVGSGMDFLAIILLSMAGAFLLVLLVELPMQRIANILLRPKSVHQRVDKSVNSS